jgi:hypothetical protein
MVHTAFTPTLWSGTFSRFQSGPAHMMARERGGEEGGQRGWWSSSEGVVEGVACNWPANYTVVVVASGGIKDGQGRPRRAWDRTVGTDHSRRREAPEATASCPPHPGPSRPFCLANLFSALITRAILFCHNDDRTKDQSPGELLCAGVTGLMCRIVGDRG